MALTAEMKREIVLYVVEWTKGIIEDCELTGNAYAARPKQVTEEEIEDFLEECRATLLAGIK